MNAAVETSTPGQTCQSHFDVPSTSNVYARPRNTPKVFGGWSSWHAMWCFFYTCGILSWALARNPKPWALQLKRLQGARLNWDLIRLFFSPGNVATRWSSTLLSKVNLNHVIDFGPYVAQIWWCNTRIFGQTNLSNSTECVAEPQTISSQKMTE
jgi:hypothetical protein